MEFEVPAGRCLSVATGGDSLAEADFAIAQRDGIELHFAVKQDHDPARTATWVYIRAPAAQPRTLPDGDRAAFELLRAVKAGNIGQLTRILAADPALASCWINSVTPLHHFADAPGHRPNAQAVVSALAAAGPTSTPMRGAAGTTRRRCTGRRATTTSR